MAFEVGERSLSPEVSSLFEGFLGCKIASEGILPERKQFDFFLILDGSRIVVELKIGFDKLNSAIVQADEYREQLKADGIIAIAYPVQAKQTVTRPEDVREIALSLRPTVTVLTPFLKHHYPQISLAELSKNLQDSLSKPTLAPSVDMVVQALRQSVQGISLEIRRTAGMDSPIIQQTVGSLSLFEILAQDDGKPEKSKEEATKSIVADLAAYILVNQILLYHILNKALQLNKRIERIVAPIELNSYFKVINDIDYKAVYCTDVVSNIAHSAANEINTVILAIRALQPENLRHDLLGRIFHEFLPFETRKRLGTFYTRPQAADILAGLAIDEKDEKVIDPACGSGTLLVSAYRKKSMGGKTGRKHKKLVEEDITGIDIMPFAAHLAALNLTMQSPLEPTDRTRIGTGNSLNFTAGDEVGNVARWLKAFGGDIISADVNEPLSKGDVFKLKPVDVVIMNPPFTRKERLTNGMKSIQWAFLGDQNYWAYFIPLADSMLKKNGKIAAVLPRDFFRGEYSRAVREYLFSKNIYRLKYVVKTTKDTAFSENARFRDYLIVLEKQGTQSMCAFIYLKKKLLDLSTVEATGIPLTIKQLTEGENFEDESIFVTWQNQSDITNSYKDLGKFVAFNTKAGEILLKLYREAKDKEPRKLTTLIESQKPIYILRGLEPFVENLLNLVFVVRPIHKDRVGRSELILDKHGTNNKAVIKNTPISIELPMKIIRKGLKTAAYVPQLDIDNICDYAMLKHFEGMEEIQYRLGIREVNYKELMSKAKDRFSYILLSRRFNFAAPGTKALAFFCSDKALGGKAFWTFSTDIDESKILCLWFNSTFSFLESLLLQSETEGSFVEITKEKLFEFHIPNFASCNIKALLEAFEQVRHVEFPPLIEQFDNPPEARRIIDHAVLKTIGYGDSEIAEILPELYRAMAAELTSWKELMRPASAKEKEPVPQLRLLNHE